MLAPFFGCTGREFSQKPVPNGVNSISNLDILRDNNMVSLSIKFANWQSKEQAPVLPIIAETAGSNGSDPSIVDPNDDAGNRNLEKMRPLYKSCMNESRIESVGRQPLVDVIKEIINLFPVRDNPYAFLQNLTALEDVGVVLMNRSSAISRQALAKTLAYFSERGLDSLLSIGIVYNASKPGRNIIRIDFNTMGWISKQYYSIGKTSDRFYVANWLYAQIYHLLTRAEKNDRTFPKTKKVTPPVGVSEDWNDFAFRAFNFQFPVWFVGHPDEAPLLTTIEGLSEKVQSIDWSLFWQAVSPGDSSRPITVAIARDVAQGFDDMLQSQGSPLSVQAYFVWRAIEQLAKQIAPKYTLFLRPGNDWELRREKYCAKVVHAQLGSIAGHFFVKKTFNRDKKVVAERVANYVRKAFIETYPCQSLLETTGPRAGCPRKYKSVVFTGHDGCCDNRLACMNLEAFYEGYKVDEKGFFGNRIRYAMWHRKNLFKDLDDASFMAVLQTLPQNVALHRDAPGRIKIPVGLLQPPFFNETGPLYKNYATIGVILAREYSSSTSFSQCPTLRFTGHKDDVPGVSLRVQLSEEQLQESTGLQRAFQAWTYEKVYSYQIMYWLVLQSNS
ncbi:unnamed protein product [Mortierella alpina]